MMPHPVDDGNKSMNTDSCVFSDDDIPAELRAWVEVWDLWQALPVDGKEMGRAEEPDRATSRKQDPECYIDALLQATRELEKRQLEYRTTQRAKHGESSGRPPRRTVLRMPPPPLPLPPCLQCSVAGVGCSLTTEPYAQGLTNDEAHHSRKIKSAVQLQNDARTSFALVVEQLKASCTTWESFILNLTRKRQKLEQQFLLQAIVQGATDSPFLLPPPDQCDRCLQDGETACLQQTMDLAHAMVARPVGMPAHEPAMEVSWFASSGAPPLSLLPQHASTLVDQIRVGHVNANMKSLSRYIQKNARLAYVSLEAVYCRDPKAMTAKDVVAKTQALLAKMEQKQKQQMASRQSAQLNEDIGKGTLLGQAKVDPMMSLVLRPATRIEISRMLPRKSPINVYAGHGVATAYQTNASCCVSASSSVSSSVSSSPVARTTANTTRLPHEP